LLLTHETGGVLKGKRQLWHFKGLPFFRNFLGAIQIYFGHDWMAGNASFQLAAFSLIEVGVAQQTRIGQCVYRYNSTRSMTKRKKPKKTKRVPTVRLGQF